MRTLRTQHAQEADTELSAAGNPPARPESPPGPRWRSVLPGLAEPWLSRSEAKRFFFSQDACFRETWRDVHGVLGGRAAEVLHDAVFILVKPDGIVARSAMRCQQAMASDGHEAVFAAPLRLNRHSVRDLWRFHLNMASLQRLDAIDLLLPETDSLLMLFRRRQRQVITACEAVAAIKGPATPTPGRPRRPDHLRTRIKAGIGLLNNIHTPDEPADLVRELGVLLEAPQRQAALRALLEGSGAGFSLAALADQVHRGTPSHDLDVPATLTRIERLCLEASPSADAAFIREAAARARLGGPHDWRAVLAAIDRIALPVARWDRIVFATSCTESDEPGVKPFLEYAGHPRIEEG